MIQRLRLKTDPAIQKKVIELKWTGKLVDWILSKLGFTCSGTTLSLPYLFVILYLVGSNNDPKYLPEIRVHEAKHCLQSELLGPFYIFWAQYIWQNIIWFIKTRNISQMYRSNKFEKEAYDIQYAIDDGKEPLPTWAAGPL